MNQKLFTRLLSFILYDIKILFPSRSYLFDSNFPREIKHLKNTLTHSFSYVMSLIKLWSLVLTLYTPPFFFRVSNVTRSLPRNSKVIGYRLRELKILSASLSSVYIGNKVKQLYSHIFWETIIFPITKLGSAYTWNSTV